MSKYDCTEDVLEHRRKVGYWLHDFINFFEAASRSHDESKLKPPEKSVFDVYTPKLKELKFGSDEYKQALHGMGEGLKHHYEINAHHPEHYRGGISEMNLYHLIEMFCDWLAASEAKGGEMDIDYLAERFGISPQLVEIFINTLNDLDFWNAIGGHATTFTPKNHNKDRAHFWWGREE